MKNLERIILIAVFVVPIVICIIVLKNIWKDDDNLENNNSNDNSGDAITSISDRVYQSGDEYVSGDDVVVEVSGENFEIAGQTFESKIGDPISKIYTDAEVSSVVTNVYLEASDTSEVVGTFDRHTKITAQQFGQGWSRVAGTNSVGISISGWVKTDNISYPDGGASLNTNGTSTGVVTAEPYLNVRLNPSTTATIVTTVNKGEVVTIEETKNGWHKVTVNGVTGWVSAEFVK